MAKILGAQIPFEPKNLAINGNFDYWQRVETATTTVNTATTTVDYTADMFVCVSQGSTVKNYSIVQSSNVPTQANTGFESQLSYLFTMVTGIASPAASDVVVPIQYRMEGYDYQAIHNRQITIGFWAYATVAGTYSLALSNSAGNRCYVTTFAISGSLTWQYVTVTISLDTVTTGWVFTNTASLYVSIGAVTGTTFQTSTTNAWQSGLFYMANGATNWQATTGAVLQISQFSITEGALGLGQSGFIRAGKTVQQELALCQRYYEKSYDIGTAIGTITAIGQHWTLAQNSTVYISWPVQYKVSKRTEPTATAWNPGVASTSGSAYNYSNSTSISASPNQNGMVGMVLSTNTTTGVVSTDNYGIHWTADAGL